MSNPAENRRKLMGELLKSITDSGYSPEEAQLAMDISIYAAQEAQRVLMATCGNIEGIEVRKIAIVLAMRGTEAAMQEGVTRVRQMVVEENGECDCVVCQLKRQLVSSSLN